MIVFTETPRLILRELVPEDAPGMFALDGDPAVLHFLGGTPHTDIEQSRAVIDFVRAQYRDLGIGRWAVELKETGEFLGWCGFKLNKETINGHTDFLDLGYRFLQKHWGQGYASEAAAACRDYAFEVMQVPVIYAMARTDHAASRRIIEKLGFRQKGFYEDEQGRGKIAWYVHPAH